MKNKSFKMLHKLKLRLHDNACARVSFLIKLQALSLQLVKLETHRCFPVNFAKFLRTPFLTEYLRWLLLAILLNHVFSWKILIAGLFLVIFTMTNVLRPNTSLPRPLLFKSLHFLQETDKTDTVNC